MKKSNKKYLILLPILWIIGCIFQYFFCCEKTTIDSKNVVASTVTGNVPPSIAVDNKSVTKEIIPTNTGFAVVSDNVNLKGKHGFDFAVDSAEPLQPYATDLDDNISKTVQYLKDNPNKQLTIIGRYHSDEKNNTGFTDLGLARADKIKAQLTTLGVNTEQIITESKVYPEAIANKDKQYLGMINLDIVDRPLPVVEPKVEEPTVVEVPKATNSGFSIVGEGLNFQSTNGFDFASNSAEPIQPYMADLDQNIAKAVQYFKDHSDKQLTVVGRYHAEEENSTPFPNLGLARAQRVKDQLISLGTNSQQIITEGKLDTKAVANEKNQYLGMIDFSVKTLDNEAVNVRHQKMDTLLSNLNANPLTLYFKTGSAHIQLSTTQKERLVQIISYLDYNPSAKAVITGHTDNTGSRNTNITIAKKRAKFVADYFANNGLNNSQFIIASKGSDMPIADNSTSEGRAKNRRVTITIDKNPK
ncbi:OmpA family protein [Pasteurella atlantica]|uniref:OmpA family protein n=1 Tax=Pasteurellaceae TaxID=712 RepID=UPI00277958F8|nr:OmpA family protein [Pasteurella atlantica]MDP8099268.1 OmpA family protein [Pasteurella atlantica]MDP8100355.1 OmpA family protein [Pasteurella atlantica]MDP8106173.1 OmpA family protein [Pasteurella atlantica]MDP8115898.1 OmpA family protein [Pasteurella atlantica]